MVNVLRQRIRADEIPGQHDQLRSQRVHLADDGLKEHRFGVLLEVKVADLHHFHARKRVRQSGKSDGYVDEFEFVTRDFTGVQHKTGGRAGSQAKEISPVDQGVSE